MTTDSGHTGFMDIPAAKLHNNSDSDTQSRTLNRGTLLTLAAYALVVVLAVVWRLILVEGYHPVIRNHDEFFRFLNTMRIRDDMPQIAEQWGVFQFNSNYSYDGFPPVQMWVHAPVQRMVEARQAFPLPPDYILAARFTSVVASVLTGMFTAWMGWYLARPLGRFPAAVSGFAASLVWTVSPIVLHVGNLALIDPLLYPYVPLILIASVYAIRNNAPVGVLLGLVFAIAAIYTKYIMIYALIPPAIATAVLAYRRGTGNNPGVVFLRGLVALWPWLAVMAAVSVASLYWLIFVHDMFAMINRETHMLYESGLMNALSPSRNWVNFSAIVAQTTGLVNYAAVVVLGVWSYRYSRKNGLPVFEWWVPVMLVPFFIVAFMLISSVVVNTGTSRMRYPIAPMIGLLGVWGLFIGQMLVAVPHWWGNRRGQSTVKWGIVAAALLPIFAYSTVENTTQAIDYSERFREQVVWEWTDGTLPEPEGTILIDLNAQDKWVKFVWDRTVSGYTGVTPFEFVHVPDAVNEAAPAEYWNEAGIAYYFASQLDIDEGGAAAQQFVDELTLLKSFPPLPGANYPTHFYRMVPPQVEADALYNGNIMLAGYDLNTDTLAGGDVLAARPFWQAANLPADNYSMFIHLRGADDPTRIIAQFDGPPAADARITPTWDDPNELVVGREVQLALPADVEPGDYELFVGLYDFETLARLTLEDGADGFTIPITIE